MKCLDKKRLIFSFYLNEETFNNPINLLHFKLMARYMPMFDEIIFCIIKDEWTSDEMVRELQTTIIRMGCGNIQFKMYENTNYRESYVIYNEVVLKLKELDGYTMWAHNKGMSDKMDIDDIKKWVCALYFFTLEQPLPTENAASLFFGPLKCINCNKLYTTAFNNRFNWFFAGTFFWMRCQEIYNHIILKGYELPLMTNRWFSEMFPGWITSEENAATYCNVRLDGVDIMGHDISERLEQLYCGYDNVLYEFNNFFETYK